MGLVCSFSHPRFWKCAHRRPGCPLKPVRFGTDSLESEKGHRGEGLENSQFLALGQEWPWTERHTPLRAEAGKPPRHSST